MIFEVRNLHQLYGILITIVFFFLNIVSRNMCWLYIFNLFWNSPCVLFEIWYIHYEIYSFAQLLAHIFALFLCWNLWMIYILSRYFCHCFLLYFKLLNLWTAIIFCSRVLNFKIRAEFVVISNDDCLFVLLTLTEKQ